jgi:hypothetical protein
MSLFYSVDSWCLINVAWEKVFFKMKTDFCGDIPPGWFADQFSAAGSRGGGIPGITGVICLKNLPADVYYGKTDESSLSI